ncbi:MAG: hypothetical protein IJV46_09725 [Acidaminococcaceae bacterium]|nr:hypothetical protein [Acidaminococcaceae bacterium]
MPSTYHFSSQPVPAGKSAAAHYDYIAREEKYAPEHFGQDDLRVQSYGNMPAWAKSPGEFWDASDRFGKVNGRSYREINVALQNDLSFDDNIKLVDEFLKESGIANDHAWCYTIHSRTSVDGTQDNIHAHIMFNEKIVEPDRPLDRYDYFRKYAENAQGEPTSGYRTSKRHSSRNGILSDRYLWESIVNKKFRERNIDERVSAKTLKAQRAEMLAQGRYEEAALLDRAPAPHMGNLLKQAGNAEKVREYIRQFQQEAAEKANEDAANDEAEKAREEEAVPESVHVSIYNDEEEKMEKKRKAKLKTAREELENIEDQNERLLAIYAHDYVIRQLAKQIQKERLEAMEKSVEKQADDLAKADMEITVGNILDALDKRAEGLPATVDNLRKKYTEAKGRKVPDEHIHSAVLNRATNGEYDRLRKQLEASNKKTEALYAEEKKLFAEYYSHDDAYYENNPKEHDRLWLPLNEWQKKNKLPAITEKNITSRKIRNIQSVPTTDKATYDKAVSAVQAGNAKLDDKLKKINKEYGKVRNEQKRIDKLREDLSKLDRDDVVFAGKVGRILTKNDKINGQTPVKDLERFVHDGNEYRITGEHNGGGQGGYKTAVRINDDVIAGSVPTYMIRYWYDGEVADVRKIEEKTKLYAGRNVSKEDAFRQKPGATAKDNANDPPPDKILEHSPAMQEAKTFRAKETAALAARAASGLIGSNKKETSNKHTKLRFRKDDGKLTEAEQILRQYFSDDADITDDLPDRKPRVDALKEIGNVLAMLRTEHQEEIADRNNERLEQEETAAADAAEQEYHQAKAERETIANRLKADYIEYRIRKYREAEKVKNHLKDTWEKEYQAAQKSPVHEPNENQGSWGKQVKQFFMNLFKQNKREHTSIPESKKEELHNLHKQWKNAERTLKNDFPEIAKYQYPEIKDPEEKIRYYYQDRQMHLLKSDISKTGYQDNGLVAKYDAAYIAEHKAFQVYESFHKNPDAPSSEKPEITEKRKEKELPKRKHIVRATDRKSTKKPYMRK